MILENLSKEQLDYIYENYKNPTKTFKDIAGVINCSRNSVASILKQLGLKEEYDKYHTQWSERDKNLVQELYGQVHIREIARRLNKKYSTVHRMITQLGLRPKYVEDHYWSEEEDNIIKANYLTMASKALMKLLPGRTDGAIQQRAKHLNIRKLAPSNKWKEEEINYLKDHYNSENYESMAKNLNRTSRAICGKCWELGLTKVGINRTKLKKDHIDFILNNYEKYTDNQMAEMFNVSERSIATVRIEYGIKKIGNEIKGPTLIERKVTEILNELNIKYYYNINVGDYRPDFYLENMHLIIEVQGDYFHCNPYLYPNGPKDEIQLKHIIRDYYKKCYFLSRGFKILYLWEYDILNNFDNVKNKIYSAVQDGDVLDN